MVASKYLQNIYDCGFIPTNFKATRIQNQSCSLIDHILANNTRNIINSGTIIEEISDHFVTFFQTNVKLTKSKPKILYRRVINDENLNELKDSLLKTTWSNVLYAKDVDECYSHFWEEFNTRFEVFLPITRVKFNRNLQKISDFMTTGLLISRKTKISLLKTFLATPNAENCVKYKKFRNMYNKVLRASKKLHYLTSIEKHARDPKKLWETLKEATTGTTKKITVNKLKINGHISTNPIAIASEFNQYFSNIGMHISNSINPVKADPMDYLQNNNCPNLLSIPPMQLKDFLEILDDMVPKSSTDIDGLSTKLLKTLKYELSAPLLHLFNLSIATGIFPTELKTSRIIPIFKGGDPLNPDNYRPISLLSSISKVLEKYIANKLVEHLESNNLLYENQYGFLRNRSTVHNLLQLTNYAAKGINEKKFVVGIFLDLKKAFDVVPHDILLKKLIKFGITGTQLKWFESYLSHRSQRVEIDDHLSTKRHIGISVLQGSILGPILFLCYINDLPKSSSLYTLLFADDTACLMAGANINELLNNVNIELSKIAEWFRANKMAVNVNKTKFIILNQKEVL